MTYFARLGVDAPMHMKARILRGQRFGKNCFEFLDGENGLGGLVNEDIDEHDERCDEIIDYLSGVCIEENKFDPSILGNGIEGTVVYISRSST